MRVRTDKLEDLVANGHKIKVLYMSKVADLEIVKGSLKAKIEGTYYNLFKGLSLWVIEVNGIKIPKTGIIKINGQEYFLSNKQFDEYVVLMKVSKKVKVNSDEFNRIEKV